MSASRALFSALLTLAASAGSPAAPPKETAYSLASAGSIGEDNGALLLHAGWPRSGVAYVIGFTDYLDVHFQGDYRYPTMFRVGGKALLQFVDLDGWLDFGLALEPMIFVSFDKEDDKSSARCAEEGSTASAGLDLSVGALLGVRPVSFITIFAQVWHRDHFASCWPDSYHGPGLVAGLEFSLPAGINLIAYGQIDWYWTDHGPDYAGGLGVGFGFF